MSTTTQQNEKVLANQSQQTQISDVQTRTIDQIRTEGLEPSVYHFGQIPLERASPEEVV